MLNWKLQETQSYQNDVWGFNLTERWYSGGVFTATATPWFARPAPARPRPPRPRPSTSTRSTSILYLDVGANWNVSDKTQLYAKVDNAANTRPPDTGGQNANNTSV